MLYLPLCLACLAIAAVFILVERRRVYLPAVLLKGAASACFVVLGILSAGLSSERGTAWVLIAGLALGAVADVLLGLRFVLAEQGQRIFLVGILVFLLGHVMYLVALVPRCPMPALVAAFILGIGATALLMRWIFMRIRAEGPIRAFGIVYVGAITVLNSVAIATMLAVPTTFSAIFVLGALLFLVSDVVLILNTFGGEESFELRVTNLTLYYLGQLLIALSLQVL